ncbi:inactive hydroxysteroid dehydrogenase-like protein 1 isoform X1 [Stylophora pistillata]|uniref:Inactive hydroxysteroid dehydrogenase-like protein 1 n=1 Tax=Stylophora pistillata TaxID=50429 RepID=A0A2B4S6Q2_STYPI|nr:inactive hydroxysteroid dehydrogenase-like protein 1 isoform X1 [Stylophora pistillata]PFX24480.1 Inactive hydroxysteroid dehydrogenase-like protein 1 [Stylophora pistillata]
MATHRADLSWILSSLDKSGFKNGLALLGLLWTAKVSLSLAFSILKGLRIYLFAQITTRNNFCIKYGGRWAVVTGASEGIGRAFACELARCGMNIVLMSRSTQKLEKVAETIEKESKVETLIIPIDFATQDVYQKIIASLEGLDIGILVNNVGVMYEYPQYFLDVPKQKLFDLININMTSVIMMTRIVLPQMCERKRGAIINMSSSAGELPTPQMTVYAATKEFVDSFSRALAYEYSPQGIEVQSLRPFYVATAMTYGTKANIVVPSPETYVKSALYTLGLSRRNTGYWSHGIQGWFVGFCPEWLWMWTATLLNNQIRRVVLKNKKQ